MSLGASLETVHALLMILASPGFKSGLASLSGFLYRFRISFRSSSNSTLVSRWQLRPRLHSYPLHDAESSSDFFLPTIENIDFLVTFASTLKERCGEGTNLKMRMWRNW